MCREDCRKKLLPLTVCRLFWCLEAADRAILYLILAIVY